MRKKLCALLAATILSVQPCFADGGVTVTATYDAESEAVTITGEATDDAIVTVVPEKTLTEDLSKDNMPLYVRQVTFDGEYVFKLKMPASAESGKYTVYVSTHNGEAADTFLYMNGRSATAALELLKQAQSREEYIKIVEDNAVNFGIDIDDAAYVRCKEKIYDLLTNFGGDYSEPFEFNNDFYGMLAISQLYGADDKTVEAVLKKYDRQLGISYDADYGADLRLSEKARKALCEYLSGLDFVKEFTSAKKADFAGIFNGAKPLAAIKSASGWQDIKKAFDVFSEIAELKEETYYTRLGDKDSVFSKMMSYTYTVPSDIGVNFKKACTEQYDREHKKENTGGSGSSGSSGGGGGSSVITLPVQQPEETVEKSMFSDVSEDFWGYAAISALSENGLIKGYTDGSFRPDSEITRAEFTMLILGLDAAAADGEERASGAPTAFVDVDSQWFATAVGRASAMGLIVGENGYFRPNDPITRQDAAVILYKTVIAYRELYGMYIFSDRTEISGYARDAVSSLAANGYISGVSEGVFAPMQRLTRAQAAQLLYNALQN